jgi:starch synthase
MKFLGYQTILMGPYEKKALFYTLDYEQTTYIFIECDELFNRPKLYGYEDDAIRFTFFNFAILEYIKLTEDFPEIIHVNDWQTGMLPFLLDVKYRHQFKGFLNIKTLLSIHNLEKQGSYTIETEKLFGNKNFTYIHDDRVNFLKCGIMRANAINTVSDNYKHEILTRFYGFSLDFALRSKAHDLYGILNGLDQDVYNPKTSKALIENYDEFTFLEAKKANKEHIITRFQFTKDLDKPLVIFNSRFARQKGIDLLMHVLEDYLRRKDFYFIAMGSGDMIYESFFKEMSYEYPTHVAYVQGFDHDLSDLLYAASDLFILPSLFEPCGLNHMIAMRYGSLPLVRETGGLKDTVTPYNKYTNIGVGFTFKNYDAIELDEALQEALALYREHKDAWQSLIQQAMHVNHSVEKMAKQYESLYVNIIKNKI